MEDKPSIEIRKEEREEVVEVPVFGSLLHKREKEEREESSGIHFVNKADNEIRPANDDKPKITRESTSFDNIHAKKETDTVQKSDKTVFSFTSKRDKMPPGISHTISSNNSNEESAQIIEEENEANVIVKIHDRKNYIIRKSSNLSKHSQIIAANIDQGFILHQALITKAHDKLRAEFVFSDFFKHFKFFIFRLKGAQYIQLADFANDVLVFIQDQNRPMGVLVVIICCLGFFKGQIRFNQCGAFGYCCIFRNGNH